MIDAYNNGRIGFEKMVKLIEDDHAPTFTGSPWDTAVDNFINNPCKININLRRYVPAGNEFELVHFTNPEYKVGDYVTSGIKDDRDCTFIFAGYAYVIGKAATTQYFNCEHRQTIYYTNVIVTANVK